ncbi:hypothetical protein [Acinetobacter sp. YH12041]|uniref:hypothetical protein n=1 Tax=Acinetobacter sp. YH12041 TaxID=2601049 RepID=UPI0015D46252|nr:hypothetical protein [Acinetobacter sp. YH12041]
MLKFILFFLLFNALYGPRLNILDLMLFFNLSIFTLYIVQMFINGRIYGSKKILISLVFLLFMSCVHYLYVGLVEFTLLDLIIKTILYFLSASFLVYWYNKIYDSDNFVILRHILYATFLNAICVIIAFFYKPFQIFLSNVLNYEKQLNWVETEHRIFDISLGGGATASFTFAIVFLMGLALPKSSRPPVFIFLMSTIAVAAALMGRTGLYFILIYVFFNLLKNILNFKYIFSYILSGFLLFVIGIYNYSKIMETEYFLWASQGIYEENGTFNTLKKMWFLPSDNLIFGDGYFGRVFPNIIYSDVGYIRVIHAIGFVGLFLLYGWLIYLLYLSKSSFRKVLNPNMKNIFTIIILMILLINFKELHFASRGTLLILFVVFLVCQEHKRKSAY